MTVLRLLNPQGITGLAAALILALLLVTAKIDVRHWRKQSTQYEQLYRGSEAALAGTIANVRAAAAAAAAADRAHIARVQSAQQSISERSADALESRLADARARAQRLRLEIRPSPTAPGGGAAAIVPVLSSRAPGAAETAGQDRLPPTDALIATEQAIQLDELIRWVRAQEAIVRHDP